MNLEFITNECIEQFQWITPDSYLGPKVNRFPYLASTYPFSLWQGLSAVHVNVDSVVRFIRITVWLGLWEIVIIILQIIILLIEYKLMNCDIIVACFAANHFQCLPLRCRHQACIATISFRPFSNICNRK